VPIAAEASAEQEILFHGHALCAGPSVSTT
jgi:hypothetical protein